MSTRQVFVATFLLQPADAYAPRIFLQGACIAASGGLLSVVAAFALSIWRARDRAVETYGSARWEKPSDVRRAGLLGPDGVVLGRYRSAYLRHDGPAHVLCFAPTRSGRGVGLVVSSLLTWPDSAIVHDIKGENFMLTAGFRARHGRVLLFDPTNSASALQSALRGPQREWEVRDVQNVADILVDPGGSLEHQNHWEKTSQVQDICQCALGVSPKWLIRCFRLQDALARLGVSSDVNLSALAQELGYFDQAHFTRDFKRVTE